jgi:hypothetical protein
MEKAQKKGLFQYTGEGWSAYFYHEVPDGVYYWKENS